MSSKIDAFGHNPNYYKRQTKAQAQSWKLTISIGIGRPSLAHQINADPRSDTECISGEIIE